VSEEVLWVAFWGAKSNTFVGEESPGKVIAVNDSEDSLVDIEVDTNVEIAPDVVFRLIIRVWELVPLQEYSLWNSGVLNSWLDDVDGIIVKIVVYDALSDPVVLVGVLNNWFLEVTVEAQNLSVILEPFWGDSWDCLLGLVSAASDTSELGWNSLGHGSDEIWVDVFLQVHSFLCDGSVLDTEKLGFVVSVDGWIGVGVSWEEWELVGQIICLHFLTILYSLMLS
jgi:hypothetical protein